MSQICGSCGGLLRVRETCTGASLCFPCARDFAAYLHSQDLVANPIFMDLMRLVGMRTDAYDHHGFLVWGFKSKEGGFPYYFVSDSQIAACIWE